MSGTQAQAAVMRALHRSLAEARDDQIAKIVAVVDSLPRRGDADELLASVRPRLTKIKPPRPMNFGRLLHTPIERIVVPGPKWKRGTFLLPRTALASITEVVRAGLPASEIAAVQALLARTDVDDETRLSEAGERLWSQAARALAKTAPPANWQETSGLPATEYLTIASSIAALLSEAATYMALRGGETVTTEAVHPILERLRGYGETVFGMAICLLLLLLPMSSAAVIRSATDVSLGNDDRKLRQVAEHAIDGAINLIDEAAIAQHRSGASRAADIERTVRCLRQIEMAATRDRPERRRRLEGLRRDLDGACRQRIEQLVVKQTEMLSQGVADTDLEELVGRLEEQIREIRRLEITGRGLSPTGTYDTMMRNASAKIRQAVSTWPGLAAVDRVRLLELLLTPEDAMRLVAAG